MTIVIISITPKDSLTIDSNRQEENGLKLQRRKYTDIAGFLPGFFVAGQDKSKSGRFSKKWQILHTARENFKENFAILVVE